jgi:hypothetical protein
LAEVHGGTATICVSVPFGTTIRFDPGGTFVAPGCVTEASEQGGTMIVRALRCFGTITVRTPGVAKAVVTGSCCAADFFLPQPVAASPGRANRQRMSAPDPALLTLGAYPTR